MAQSKDLGNGLRDHGVAAPVARSRGAVATVDGTGRNVVLVYLSDHRACTSLLVIDAATGETKQADVPPHAHDSPFAVILSSRNRFFSHFGTTFMEFDPATGAFTFSGKTDDRVAMSMTEDANGVIWAGTYPKSHIVGFDPVSRALTDYGSVNAETWPQYPRSIAADADGWVYIGIGSTYSHIVGLNPETKQIVPLASEEERVKGTGYVMKGKDGKVYGRPNTKTAWFELRGGKRLPTGLAKQPPAAPIRAGSQEYVGTGFPDGGRIVELDIPERFALIRDAGGDKARRITFDYATEGSHIISVAAGPDGGIYGSTGHPLRVYRYAPAEDTMTNHGLLDYNGHWNAVTAMGDKLYGGQYGHGILWQYDPSKGWADADKEAPNPRKLAQSSPEINRPHELLAHPDGKHLILAGTPGYGRTGGGMHIYNVETGEAELLSQEQLLPTLSTTCLEALSANLLVGGTATWPGTGGETLAKEAELYLFDFGARKVIWREAVLPGVPAIRDLKLGADGLVYGLADGPVLFVFDPEARQLVHRETVTQYGGVAGGQAPRTLLLGPDGAMYAYLQKAIVRIDAKPFAHRAIAKPAVDIQIGIALVGGRFYFAAGSHLYSCALPARTE